MKDTIKEIREAHERIGKLLSQMEAAGVPTVETPQPELQDYVMEVKELSERKRALAAAIKLGYPIHENPFCQIDNEDITHFHAMQSGSVFLDHGDLIGSDLPITLVDFEKLAGIEHDPLEGKAVKGFYTSAVSTGLIFGKQQLFFEPKNSVFCVATHRDPAPHHLTRVTSRTVGRFYLIEGCSGDKPQDFGLYLGDKYVRWGGDPYYPIFNSPITDDLTMYEVTPNLQ